MERRHLDLGAPDRLGDRERHLDLDVVALALEHRAVLHAGDHEQVAGRPAVAAGLALAGEADARALADAGGDVHAVALRRAHGALAVAGRARVLDDGARAVAAGARLRDREEALALRLEAAALAARADLRLGARPRAGPVAGRAARRHGDAERHLCALERLVERDADLGLEVAAALGLRAPRSRAALRAAPEQVREDVAEAAGLEAAEAALATAGARPAAPATGAEEDPAAVVLLALVRVAHDVVGGLDLLEALLGLGVVRVAVRVVLARELAVGLLDLLGRRLAVDAEDGIWVSLGHLCPLLRGHDDLGRPQHVVAIAVALAVDLDDRPALGALDGLLGDRLVAVRVERLALRRVLLDPHARERRQQLVLHEPDAVGQVVVAVLGLRLGGVERAREVVQRGQELAGELRDAAGLGLRDVAARALADVVELGHCAQVLVLVVGLGRLRLGLRRGRVVGRLRDARRGRAGLGLGRAVGVRRRDRDLVGPGRAVHAVGRLALAGRGRGGLLSRRALALRPGLGVALHGLRLPFVDDLGVHDVLLLGGSRRGAVAVGVRAVGRRLLLLGALVHRLGDLVEGGLERLGLRVDLVRVLGRQALADVLDRGLDLLARGVVDLLAEVLELALGLVGGVLAAVAGLRELAGALVLVGVRLGVVDHALDLVVAEAAAGADLDLLLLAGAEVLRRHVEDAVRVDVEADLDLRDAAGRRRDAGQLELAERLVVGRHLALALQDVDLHGRLVVLGRREDLGLTGRDRRVALDELRHHAALGLDAERERGDVEQEDVLHVAGQDARLDGGADGHDLVRVDAAVRLLAGELLDLLLDGRHPSHAADEDDVVDLVGALVLGVVERLADRDHDAVEQVARQLVELRAGEAHVEVLRAALVGGDERQVDLRLLRRRQLDLGLLGGLVEALESHRVLRQVDALALAELGRQPVDDRLVEVVAAEVVVAGGRLDLEDAVADLEDRHVERAAAEVDDEDRLVGLLVEAVGERRGGRLVDDPLDVEARDAAGVLRGLALVVVEVRGDGDDRAVDRVAEIGLGVGLELLQDHRADLRRAVLLAAGLDARVAVRAADDLVGDDRLLLLDLALLAAHEALDREDGVRRVGDGLALRDGADEALAALREGHHRRGGPPALGVLDDGRLAALEDGHARIRRAEVDANGLGHMSSSPSASSICAKS